MRTAAILGGGPRLHRDLDDLRALGMSIDGVVLCNDAGTAYAGEIEAWATLHPEHLPRWIAARAARGFPPARRLFAPRQHPDREDLGIEIVPELFPGARHSGTSGLYAAKAALIDLGFDRGVFCGIPMDPTRHFFDRQLWRRALKFRAAWRGIRPEFRARLRSMWGWSRTYLGFPSDWLDAAGQSH